MNESIIRIKNMVCARCVSTVHAIAEHLDLQPVNVELGVLKTRRPVTGQRLQALQIELKKAGFALITDRRTQTTEQIKAAIIGHFYGDKKKPAALNFSDWIAEVVNMSYSHLSVLFSTEEGVTLERYIIAQRIERAKELLSYGQKSMSEISDELGYRSPQHFSGQFRNVTGMSPTQYKKHGGEKRRGVDEV